MKAELGQLHTQLKQMEDRHLSEGSVASTATIEEEQRNMRNGYKTSLDDVRGAIIDLEREHEKLHLQYRCDTCARAHGSHVTHVTQAAAAGPGQRACVGGG